MSRKEVYAQEQFQRVKARKALLRKQLQAYREGLSCQVCGENHPAVLDFHHRNPLEKDRSIAEMVVRGWGWERMLREIAKCDVLCSNCHRKFHYSAPIG